MVTVSRGYAAELGPRLGRDDIVVVHNCPPRPVGEVVRSDAIREAAGIPAGAPIVLYHGGLRPGRGIRELAEAMLEPGLERAHLAFLGFGPSREEAERLASEPRFGGRIHVLGPVPPMDVVSWVASVDVAAMPIQANSQSYYLSTPNKMFEAFAAGVPVVASDFPGMRGIVCEDPERPLGELCDPADPCRRSAGRSERSSSCPRTRGPSSRHAADRPRSSAGTGRPSRPGWSNSTGVSDRSSDRRGAVDCGGGDSTAGVARPAVERCVRLAGLANRQRAWPPAATRSPWSLAGSPACPTRRCIRPAIGSSGCRSPRSTVCPDRFASVARRLAPAARCAAPRTPAGPRCRRPSGGRRRRLLEGVRTARSARHPAGRDRPDRPFPATGQRARSPRPADLVHAMAYMGIPIGLDLGRRDGAPVVYDARDIYMDAANIARLPGAARRLFGWVERRLGQAGDPGRDRQPALRRGDGASVRRPPAADRHELLLPARTAGDRTSAAVPRAARPRRRRPGSCSTRAASRASGGSSS